MSLAIFITAGCLTSACVGAIAAHLATRWSMTRDFEVLAMRKDTAVEAAMGTAFELQRLSGDHPAIVPDADLEVPVFMADSGYRPPTGRRID